MRALTRSPDRPAARALADRGAEVAAGNLEDADLAQLRAAGEPRLTTLEGCLRRTGWQA
ncbi:hypothetical protein [Streptomyces uncialis]|uniref:hypothetical protein n=1 Tax=Streptomyces uncialis TaxID=1048205 RepID=UPI00386813ED|nr:hypothetical protein OG268_07580 [Streptomyces uncialis]